MSVSHIKMKPKWVDVRILFYQGAIILLQTYSVRYTLGGKEEGESNKMKPKNETRGVR